MTKRDPEQNPAADGFDGARRVASVKGTKGDAAKEARVKAALKANIAKRKAQAKLRGDTDPAEEKDKP
ncbi:hypothetical protein [Pararhodobacter marinus]|uniref:Uncharacterized protein n=1 Tax=Pararhodobacter marinus TaxID=2184063 RepID=A0A2U2C9H6_9RHOB|nr:hypothetical protein [Pararhodobacter marinus]PWE28444.1 hypothetical protein C4N9_10610 [Pararhodobacter marinus]